MKRLDELIAKNAEGLLSDSDRWNITTEIEISVDSEFNCKACEKNNSILPSKAIGESDYCRGHLRYSLAKGIEPYSLLK